MFIFSKLYILDYNYSFSGLKIFFLYFLCDWLKEDFDFIEYYKNDLVVLLEVIIVDILMDKLRKVVKNFKINEVVVVGGVLVNNGFCNLFCEYVGKYGWNIYILKFSFIMDNVVMIVIIGYYKYLDNDFCIIDKFVYLWVII